MTGESEQPTADELRRRLEEAREAYERAREAEREARHAERHAERESERTQRREERRERRRMRFAGLGFDPTVFAQGFVKDFVFGGADAFGGKDAEGEVYSETVNGRFTVSGMPQVRVANVAGRTTIRVGPDGEVTVVARKYVRGSSEERAKRVLQNFEVRMEQDGERIEIAPHLYEQERTWADLFRGGRVAVDFDVVVPRETRLHAQTVSGDLSVTGTRGPLEAHGVSGDVTLEDLQGPLRLKTVSGDAVVRSFAGALDANSVSGDVSFEASRIRSGSIVTVSGDVTIDGELEPGDEHRIKTISGDVDLGLGGDSYTVEFRSMSGDASTSLDAHVQHEGRRDKTIRVGSGATRVRVKTVSGDLEVKRSVSTAPEAAPAAEGAEAAPAAETAQAGRDEARDVLDRLARGELSVDEAAAALDSARGRTA